MKFNHHNILQGFITIYMTTQDKGKVQDLPVGYTGSYCGAPWKNSEIPTLSGGGEAKSWLNVPEMNTGLEDLHKLWGRDFTTQWAPQVQVGPILKHDT